jgi:branched-chain amino acid aminotransferase
MCMPEMPVDIVRQSFDALVGLDHDWVPRKPGTSLYLRPTVIATDVMLGVHPAHSYLYFLILSPVGSYYKEGVKPVRILASDRHVRAVRGGTGEAKTAANYAASLAGQRDAAEAGFTQVLYLDAVEHRWLDEVGTMNIMVRIGDEVITPPLAGTILDGVTRASTIQLMRDWGLTVTERQIAIEEVLEAADAGTLREMWGTGTAAVVSPVGVLGHKGRQVTINGGETGELTRRLYDAVVGIQYGRTNDAHGWTSVVPVAG